MAGMIVKGGKALLPQGFIETDIVVYDGKIARTLYADRGKRARSHQQFSISGEHEHAAARLRESETKPDCRGAAHATPQRKIQRMVAGVGCVPRRRAQSGNDHQFTPIGQQRPHD